MEIFVAWVNTLRKAQLRCNLCEQCPKLFALDIV
jgi:hypothetical protein